MNVYTIGFTKKSAEEFFDKLKKHNIKKVIDIRLNNSSQLAGFAKGKDLKYFLKELLDIEYEHQLDYAPTKEILDNYKKKNITWDDYEEQFIKVIENRKVGMDLESTQLDGVCFLCSEHEPTHCHRSLLVEYLNKDNTLHVHHL